MEDIFDKLQAITGISKYSNSEVITPQNIVKDMVDLLPANIFEPNSKFLDPAVKSGRFLMEIYRRLMTSPLLAYIPESKRKAHILNNQLYGLATSPMAATITRKALYGNPKDTGNIAYIDRYLTLMANKGTDFCKLIEKEFGEGMKFDVVIGNPPYQKTTGKETSKGVASGTTIYDRFVINSIKLSSNFVCMITPTKWFCGNKKLDALRETLLTDKMVEMHIFYANDVFPNIIMDKICYYLYGKNYAGDCNIVTHSRGNAESTCSIRKLAIEGLDCFIENDIEASIVLKVLNHRENRIENKVSSQNPFGLISSTRGSIISYGNCNIGLHYTGYECQGDNMGYLEIDDIPKGRDLIKAHKVLYPHGGSTNDRIFTRVLYAGPNEVCTQSYLVVGPFDSKATCENVIGYLKTKFVRVLIRVRKVDQHLDSDRLRFVPVQDFSKPWTDQMLYEKYGLTQEEINYIEDTIKPME